MDKAEKISSRHVLIDYTNHAGVRQQRTIVPDLGGIFFGVSQWHAEEQWLLNAYDVGKEDVRTFAVADIHGWSPADSRIARVERSLAKQLQESVERNGRMVARLKKLAGGLTDASCTGSIDGISRLVAVQASIQAILKDEEPTWPA